MSQKKIVYRSIVPHDQYTYILNTLRNGKPAYISDRLDNPEEVVLKEDGKIYELNTGKEVIDMDEYNTKHKNAQDTIVESLYMKLFTKYGNPVVKSTPILIFHTPHGLICYNACTDTLVTRK